VNLLALSSPATLDAKHRCQARALQHAAAAHTPTNSTSSSGSQQQPAMADNGVATPEVREQAVGGASIEQAAAGVAQLSMADGAGAKAAGGADSRDTKEKKDKPVKQPKEKKPQQQGACRWCGVHRRCAPRQRRHPLPDAAAHAHTPEHRHNHTTQPHARAHAACSSRRWRQGGEEGDDAGAVCEEE
jgi:hypothetical protein